MNNDETQTLEGNKTLFKTDSNLKHQTASLADTVD
jgi:hypothetical protein